MPQIYDMGPTALLPLRRKKACWGFFHPKNQTALAGFEPAYLGTKGQHATPRPPKPHGIRYPVEIKCQLLLHVLEVFKDIYFTDILVVIRESNTAI